MPKKKKTGASVGHIEGPAPKTAKSHHTGPACLSSDDPAGLFQSLIHPMGQKEFFRDVWEKRPLHLQRSDPANSSYYQSLFHQPQRFKVRNGDGECSKCLAVFVFAHADLNS